MTVDYWKLGYKSGKIGQVYDPPVKSGDRCLRWCMGWLFAKKEKASL